MNDFGISLTGGGARGCYQAGVLKGLVEILSSQNLIGEKMPFGYWSGTSAGSINASVLASGLDNIETAAEHLVRLWSEISPEQVYRTDLLSIGKNAGKWVRDLTFGHLFKKKMAHALLDTAPLWKLLGDNVNFANIDNHVNSGLLRGLACSAYSYSNNRTVTFLQTNEDCSWDRARRYSHKTRIKTEHVMASCAIPLLFPSIRVEHEYFADGGFRNLSPISPLVHLGARKILLIGVRGSDEFSEKRYVREPTIAKISGAMLNALFFDTIDIDLERLKHINEMVEAIDEQNFATKRSSYGKIEHLLIRPSRDVSRMAQQKVKNFPRMIDFLMGGLGPISESAELASYILFVPEFTKDLIELGYHDTLSRKKELIDWLAKT